jgi:hypothetical protein
MSRENPTVDELISEVKAAQVRVGQLQGLMSNTLEWRNDSIRKLRSHISASEIAARLELTRQTVYAVLQGEPIASEELDPEELPDLIHRLSQSAQQFQNMVDGKSTMAQPNPVGFQMLADNLKWAIDWLGDIETQRQRLDKWTYQLLDDWKAYEEHRFDDDSKSRQYPHQQDIIVHHLANRLGARDTAVVLGIPYEQVLGALERPGLDGKTGVEFDMDLLVSGQPQQST